LVKSVSWQWDETTQRCSQILQERFANERLSKEKTAVQVMMQSGTVRSFECTSGKCAADEAIFCRATFLPTTSANHLLQGFFGNYPLDLEDEELLGRVSAQCVFLVLPFSHDRAASNYKMLKCLWNLLSRSSVPLNIAPHSEACTLHGFALVKNRPSFGRNLVKAGFSFTRLLRNWRDLDVWRRELMKIIKGRLVVRREPMPAESKALNKSIVKALFGTEDNAYLWVTSKNSERRKTQLHLDIEDLARHLELGKPVGDIIHWCWVEEGSEENIVLKQAPGSACCSSRDDSVLKVLTVVLNYLVARAWVVGAESRWTDSTNTSKRMFLGFAGYELVPESLKNMQAVWSASEDLEARLAAIVAMEPQSWDAKRKLRLLRICKALCRPDTFWELALLISGTNAIDALIYEIFGHAKTKRATFRDLLPSLAEAQATFAAMLSSWSGGASHWVLFKAARGDWQSAAARVRARGHTLQLGASLFEHFELFMSEPPIQPRRAG
jgi:hypothetical protein